MLNLRALAFADDYRCLRSVGDAVCHRSLTVAALIPALVAIAAVANAGPPGQRFDYPDTKKLDVVEELHGIQIADPYRWMEDLDAAEVAKWVAAQNEITFGFLEAIPCRNDIKARLTKLWDYERFGVPFREGGRYFITRNDGLQNQSVLYVMEGLDTTPRVLLDPNKLSAEGTVALSTYAISEDAKYMAYGLSEAGSDWIEFKVREIETGEDLKDHLRWIKFSGASWAKDGSGFYYSRYAEPEGDKLEVINQEQKLYFHELGQPQERDRLVYFRPDEPKWGYDGEVTEDGRYLIITIREGTERKNRIFYQDLQAGDGETIELLNEFDALYSFIGNDGPVFYFFTNNDAPLGRIVAIDTRDPAPEHWRTVVPEKKETLEGANLLNKNMLVASYLMDAQSLVRVYDLEGKHIRDIDLPGIGSAGGFSGERDDIETFYAFSSFSVPTTIYRYDMETGRSTVFRQPKVDFNPDEYVTKQVFATSKDGTKVPMFITHRKDVELNGQNATLLYGYGGFNIPLTPRFSISRLVWMELGGVYAQANLRGGGEYGRDWHDAGRLKNKQNVFDDCIACAEWLTRNGYTQPSKLAVQGGSNGGLLVGAVINQRPDLFGAALPAVGVMDMLRFHKFTIGWAWTSDYGSPDEVDDFNVLYKYSPLHNLKAGACYPATLVTTADHDDRVVPSHSFKYIAALQEAQSCDNPVLIRIETKAGHGAGKPTTKIIEEIADEWAFLVRVLDMSPQRICGEGGKQSAKAGSD